VSDKVNAVNDVLTLAGAFGQFTNSLKVLHDTRVQVEIDLRVAEINKANYDYLHRMRLPFRDPDRITSQNYMTELAAHGQKIDGYMNNIRGNKAVKAGVEAALFPSTKGFMLKIEEELYPIYKQETQQLRAATYDTVFSSAASRKEQLEIASKMYEEDKAEGTWDPSQARKMEVTLEKLRGETIASDLMGLVKDVSTKKEAVSSASAWTPESVEVKEKSITPSDLIKLLSTDETKKSAASIGIKSADKLQKEVDAMTGTEKAAALESIQAWQKGIDTKLSDAAKIFTTKRKDDTLTESDIIEFGDYLVAARGMASDAEFDAAIGEYTSGFQAINQLSVSEYTDKMIAAYGDDIPEADAMKIMSKINSMVPENASEDIRNNASRNIDRIKGMIRSGSQSSNELNNSWKTGYEALKRKVESPEGGATQWDLINYLNNYTKIAIQEGFSGADVFIRDRMAELDATGGINSRFYNEVIKNQYDYFTDEALLRGIKDTDMKAIAIAAGDPKKEYALTKDQKALMVAIRDTGTALSRSLNQGGVSDLEGVKEEYKKIAGVILSSAKIQLDPFKKGIWNSTYQKSIAEFAGVFEGGEAAPFFATNLRDQKWVADSMKAGSEAVKKEYSKEISKLKELGLISKGAGDLQPISVGLDTYYIDAQGYAYEQNPQKDGSGLAITRSTEKVDKKKASNPEYLKSLEYTELSKDEDLDRMKTMLRDLSVKRGSASKAEATRISGQMKSITEEINRIESIIERYK